MDNNAPTKLVAEAERLPESVTYRAACADPSMLRWRPSLYMKKGPARLWLRVTDVRVERVQEISEYDARAEGCSADGGPSHGPTDPVEYVGHSACDEFAALWDSINAKRPGCSWENATQ